MSSTSSLSGPATVEVRQMLEMLHSKWGFLMVLGYKRLAVQCDSNGDRRVAYRSPQRNRRVEVFFCKRMDTQQRRLLLGVDLWKDLATKSTNMMISLDRYIAYKYGENEYLRVRELSWKQQVLYYATLLEKDLHLVLLGEEWLEGYQPEPGHE